MSREADLELEPWVFFWVLRQVLKQKMILLQVFDLLALRTKWMAWGPVCRPDQAPCARMELYTAIAGPPHTWIGPCVALAGSCTPGPCTTPMGPCILRLDPAALHYPHRPGCAPLLPTPSLSCQDRALGFFIPGLGPTPTCMVQSNAQGHSIQPAGLPTGLQIPQQ